MLFCSDLCYYYRLLNVLPSCETPQVSRILLTYFQTVKLLTWFSALIFFRLVERVASWVMGRLEGRNGSIIMPRPGGINWWCCLTSVCLTSVWRLSRSSGRRVACSAGRLGVAYWLIGPGSAGLAQGCYCALPLQAWRGHIVAAVRLQLIIIIIIIIKMSMIRVALSH